MTLLIVTLELAGRIVLLSSFVEGRRIGSSAASHLRAGIRRVEASQSQETPKPDIPKSESLDSGGNLSHALSLLRSSLLLPVLRVDTFASRALCKFGIMIC